MEGRIRDKLYTVYKMIKEGFNVKPEVILAFRHKGKIRKIELSYRLEDLLGEL